MSWVIRVFGLFFTFLFLASCLEQFDPRPDWKKFSSEREMAHRTMPELGPKGEFPDLEGGAVAAVPVTPELIDEKYQTFCASCHGASGKGDGPAGQALKPPARNFVDAAWQSGSSDERISKVIEKGGMSVGLSAGMAPWGSVLNAEEIAGMVKKVRSFAP